MCGSALHRCWRAWMWRTPGCARCCWRRRGRPMAAGPGRRPSSAPAPRCAAHSCRRPLPVRRRRQPSWPHTAGTRCGSPARTLRERRRQSTRRRCSARPLRLSHRMRAASAAPHLCGRLPPQGRSWALGAALFPARGGPPLAAAQQLLAKGLFHPATHLLTLQACCPPTPSDVARLCVTAHGERRRKGGSRN